MNNEGKIGELRNGCFETLEKKKSDVLTLAIKLSVDAVHYIMLFAWTIFLVILGV